MRQSLFVWNESFLICKGQALNQTRFRNEVNLYSLCISWDCNYVSKLHVDTSFFWFIFLFSFLCEVYGILLFIELFFRKNIHVHWEALSRRRFSSLNLEQMRLSQHRIMPLAVFNYEINSPWQLMWESIGNWSIQEFSRPESFASYNTIN